MKPGTREPAVPCCQLVIDSYSSCNILYDVMGSIFSDKSYGMEIFAGALHDTKFCTISKL